MSKLDKFYKAMEEFFKELPTLASQTFDTPQGFFLRRMKDFFDNVEEVPEFMEEKSTDYWHERAEKNIKSKPTLESFTAPYAKKAFDLKKIGDRFPESLRGKEFNNETESKFEFDEDIASKCQCPTDGDCDSCEYSPDQEDKKEDLQEEVLTDTYKNVPEEIYEENLKHHEDKKPVRERVKEANAQIEENAVSLTSIEKMKPKRLVRERVEEEGSYFTTDWCGDMTDNIDYREGQLANYNTGDYHTTEESWEHRQKVLIARQELDDHVNSFAIGHGDDYYRLQSEHWIYKDEGYCEGGTEHTALFHAGLILPKSATEQDKTKRLELLTNLNELLNKTPCLCQLK